MSEATLSRADAIAVVEDWLRREEEPSAEEPLGVVEESIKESADAYILAWQSQAYLDGDEKAFIFGTFPVLVDKHDGRVVPGLPKVAFDTQLAEYAASRERDTR